MPFAQLQVWRSDGAICCRCCCCCFLLLLLPSSLLLPLLSLLSLLLFAVGTAAAVAVVGIVAAICCFVDSGHLYSDWLKHAVDTSAEQHGQSPAKQNGKMNRP